MMSAASVCFMGLPVMFLSFLLPELSDSLSLNQRDEITTASTPPVKLQRIADLPSSRDVLESFNILNLRPQKECARHSSSERQFYCPSPNVLNPGKWPCIRAVELCNSIPDCPRGEDEDPKLCMFHLAEREEQKMLKELLARHFLQHHYPEEQSDRRRKRMHFKR